MILKLSDWVPNDYLLVEIHEDALRQFAPELLPEQRGWRNASKKGWSMRVDPARPEMIQMRHVHVARSEHVRAKGQQVAWNDNGTRHDRRTFNSNIEGLRTAERIAREVLNLPDSVILERVVDQSLQSSILAEGLSAIIETAANPIILKVRSDAGRVSGT